MANECATLNPEFMMKNGIKCPAFESGKNCWAYDWMPMFQNMAAEEKDQAEQFMAHKCPQCPAFREPMRKMIETIQQV